MSQLDQINRPGEDGPIARDLYFVYMLLLIGTALVSNISQYLVLSGNQGEWFEFLGPGMRDLVRQLDVAEYVFVAFVSIVLSHFAGSTNVQRTKKTFFACLLFGVTHFLIEMGPVGAAASETCGKDTGATRYFCQNQFEGVFMVFTMSAGLWALVVVPYALFARKAHGWWIEIECMLAAR